MTNVVTVRMSHIRQATLCSRGARAWFAANGLDWSKFLSEGIAAETLEATGDPLALKVCGIAREEHLNG
ncbi:hypothetical protein HDIA_0771 [Hartmannibacter diazotrophicus]|uniref:Uncharacterized protein n=1 Tax=Hartmannibacter diazotrophicus TaxID=1482074 RepID=A0A2C9D1V9_9HYPH|nr:hypothetical protein [Hartmannibacter diazotrophicus]SON54312.1 hypothetical protein HDIA_0771 [Hartmannibacter diazotrophicus]